MKRRLQLFLFVMISLGCLLGGIQSIQAEDTAVVGRPYYFYGAPYGSYYGPGAAYPAYGENPNPALQRYTPTNPYNLGRQIQRNNTGQGPFAPYGGLAPVDDAAYVY
jgi:hypothetical protein